MNAEENSLTAELGHARLKCDSGARARVLEDQTDRFTGQVAVRLSGATQFLQPRCGVEHLRDLVPREIGVGEDAPPLQPRTDGEGA